MFELSTSQTGILGISHQAGTQSGDDHVKDTGVARTVL